MFTNFYLALYGSRFWNCWFRYFRWLFTALRQSFISKFFGFFQALPLQSKLVAILTLCLAALFVNLFLPAGVVERPLPIALAGLTTLGAALWVGRHGTYLKRRRTEEARWEAARRFTLNEFLQMDFSEFERAVGSLLGRYGWRLRQTGGPGDLAADLTGWDPEGRSAVVQCKKYGPGNNVGSGSMQAFIGMAFVHHDAITAVFATTSNGSR